jgi:uncharacterized protein with HEPN domain
MRPEAPKLLEDIRDAAEFILASVANKSLEQFKSDRLLYQAVERNFEIIGEAMNRLAKADTQTSTQINHYPQIIAFRNILAHGYDLIDREIVWHVIQND